MLDPYHKPMESVGECDHANDHIAALEACVEHKDYRHDLLLDAMKAEVKRATAAEEQVKERDAEWDKLRGLLTAMGRQGPALEMMARIEADRKQDR